jgi:excisionase family DNA binding protein
MNDKDADHPTHSSSIILYQTDGRSRIEVRLENETVWLTQQLMAELFQTTIPNISMHIRNVYADGELTPEATVKEFLTVRQEGNRDVQRSLEFYNLDMIISVGYRVKSAVATRFRQWATERLREYIVKGFTLDDGKAGRSTRDRSGQKPDGNVSEDEHAVLLPRAYYSAPIATFLTLAPGVARPVPVCACPAGNALIDSPPRLRAHDQMFAADRGQEATVTRERCLSVDEIAVRMGVNPNTIFKWIDKVETPSHKMGQLRKACPP